MVMLSNLDKKNLKKTSKSTHNSTQEHKRKFPLRNKYKRVEKLLYEQIDVVLGNDKDIYSWEKGHKNG